MGSGSEVEPLMEAQQTLWDKGIDARVISMPSMDLYEQQPSAYKESVMPSSVRKRIAMEAGVSMPWYKYVGLDGATVCIDHFGASAPAGTLFEKFGLTAKNVAQTAEKLMK